MAMLVIAGLLFLAIHLVPATPLRSAVVGAIGEGPYMGLFVLLSFATIIWWIWAFEHTAFDPPLWNVLDWWPWIQALLVLFALILAVGGVASPNPSTPHAGALLERPDIGHGIFAITRHPLMWGFGMWAIAHLVAEPNWRGFWFFGVFAIVAIGGAWLQDRRKAATLAGWQHFAAETSFVPFVAALRGRAKLSLKEIGWWRIAVAVVLWAVLFYLHPWLFGVSPLPGIA